MNLRSVLDEVRQYNAQGISCSLSYMAVTNNSRRLVKREVYRYIKILNGIAVSKVDADVTVKMHQLGIYIDEEFAYKAVEEIVISAVACKNFVWIDMYLPDTVDSTLRIFRELRKKYQNVGICLQAYLERTENDMHEMLKDRVPLRLVKGFYKEYDFDRWEDVTENYEVLLEYMLTHSDRPAIATHDPDIIEKAKVTVKRIGAEKAEFQFFKKVRDDLAAELAKNGYHVRIYIPLGDFWKFFIAEVRTFDLWQNFKRLMNFIFARIMNLFRPRQN